MFSRARWFVLLLTAVSSLQLFAAGPDATITVDLSKTAGPYRPAWNYFGADEPNYVYAPNGKKLLREFADLSPAPPYFRTHNLLTTGNGEASLKWGSTNVYTEKPDGTPVYDWTITDRIFDTFKETGVRPLVEVGFMPEALSTHPQPYRHDFPKGDVFTGWAYPPRDYDKWSALVTAWVEHLHQRYGSDVDNWLWEPWNEPDIGYWKGTPEEFFRLYDVTAAAIRKVLPNAKIGGPDSTNPSGKKAGEFLSAFLEHCARGKNAATGGTGAPLDFIAFHAKGQPTTVNGHVRMNVAAQLQAVERGMQIVASFPEFKNLPIILGESDPEGCAACKGPQNAYRNGPLYGVSVAEATARTYELAAKNNVNLAGIVTWAFEFEDQPYFAGFRELATNGIDKPVLNVFRMLGKLRGNWLTVSSSGARSLDGILKDGIAASPDINAIATRTENEVDIFVWNYHDDDVATAPASIEIHISNLPQKKLTVERFLMDGSHSNAYAVWKKMGSPEKPTPAQLAQLEKAGQLQSVPITLSGASSTKSANFTLERQGVTLLRVRW